MRNLLLLLIVALATSCGASKKALEAQNQMLLSQMSMNQQSQPQELSPQRPNRTLRTQDPCEELALADSENLRAFGTSTSYIEKTARNEASRDARNQLAQMIRVAVEGASQDYAQNATRNIKNTAQELGETIMTQYVAEIVENTKPIKWAVYDLTDGSIQVNVCIEMVKTTEVVKEELSNALDRDEVIEIQYDRDRFIDKVASGLEDYKKQQKEQQQ